MRSSVKNLYIATASLVEGSRKRCAMLGAFELSDFARCMVASAAPIPKLAWRWSGGRAYAAAEGYVFRVHHSPEYGWCRRDFFGTSTRYPSAGDAIRFCNEAFAILAQVDRRRLRRAATMHAVSSALYFRAADPGE